MITKPFLMSHCSFLVVLFIFIQAPLKAYSYQPVPGKVTASVGPYFFDGDFRPKPNDSYYPRPKLGFALIAEAVFAENAALEIGLFYLDKPYYREANSNFLMQKIKRIYITTGYRFWWSKYLSTSLGLFSSFSMGDVVDVESSSGLPEDFITNAEEITNYGLDTSFRFEYDLSKDDGFFIDFRYSFNVTAETDGENANHFAVGIFYMRDIKVD